MSTVDVMLEMFAFRNQILFSQVTNARDIHIKLVRYIVI